MRIRFARAAARIESNARTTEKRTSRRAGRPAADLDSRAVPEHINARYIKVGNKYHFPNGDLAFADRGRGLSTRTGEYRSHSRSHCHCARSGVGTTIAFGGTERFRKEAWQQANLAGLAVRGYRPSELERAQLARLIGRERDEARVRHRRNYRPLRNDPRRGPTAAEEAVRAEARARLQAPDRVHAGRLLDHGAANYKHDRHADLSYFVKIDTPDGERTLWGKDLERAVEQSLSRAEARR